MVVTATLLSNTIAVVVPTPPSPFSHLELPDNLDFASVQDLSRWSAPTTSIVARADAEWDDAVTSGGNLWAGMQSDDRKASFLFRTDPHTKDPLLQTVQSPHDGDLIETMTKWGYYEDPVENAKIDKECDFDEYQKCKRAFDELGIKTAPKSKGGPNWCVQWDHQNGPKVLRDKDNKLPPLEQQKYMDESCGKEYRVSGNDIPMRIAPC